MQLNKNYFQVRVETNLQSLIYLSLKIKKKKIKYFILTSLSKNTSHLFVIEANLSNYSIDDGRLRKRAGLYSFLQYKAEKYQVASKNKDHLHVS